MPAAPKTTESTPAGTTPERPKAVEQRIARSATLKLNDFPSGWAAKDDTDDGSDSDSPCKAIEDAKGITTARRNSPTFEGEGESQVENSVYVFADGQAAENAFAELSGPETRACIRDAAVDGIEEKAKGEDLEVGEVESGELRVDTVADDTAAARFTIPLSSQGIDVDATIDLVFVRAQRAVSFLVLTSVFTPFDETLRGELTRTAGRRLEDAVGVH